MRCNGAQDGCQRCKKENRACIYPNQSASRSAKRRTADLETTALTPASLDLTSHSPWESAQAETLSELDTLGSTNSGCMNISPNLLSGTQTPISPRSGAPVNDATLASDQLSTSDGWHSADLNMDAFVDLGKCMVLLPRLPLKARRLKRLSKL